MSGHRPNPAIELTRLKDFQRHSAKYVFRRLYLDPDRVSRFLLADEVGLGKTLVARGVVALAVDHLWDRVERIDVVYICSNAQIARQNVARIRVGDDGDQILPNRLTLLPLHIKELRDQRCKLNFVAFTPGTSFEMSSGSGIREERALLYCLLEEAWQLSGAAHKNIFQGWSRTEGWREYLAAFRRDLRGGKRAIDPTIQAAFVKRLAGERDLSGRFENLCVRFARDRQGGFPREDLREMDQFIAVLRRHLAHCCVERLKPDLVILDEFQRFRHLLHGEDEIADLARQLFEWPDVRVLLVSATPYKMYTINEEHGGEDDHYRDFLETTRFLFDSSAETGAFGAEVQALRRAVCLGPMDGARLRGAREAVERRLRKVMCRTERLAVSPDRNGMLAERLLPAGMFKAEDATAFRTLATTAQAVGAGDCLELWKSGAFLLNFMEEKGYELKRKLNSAAERDGERLRVLLRRTPHALFPSHHIERYEPVDPGNARLRALIDEVVVRGPWRWLWIPPSLPYYEPGGVYAGTASCDFTKVLAFSSWHVAPKALAVLASYEAERLMVRGGDPEASYSTLRERHRPLLRFAMDGERPASMSLFTLLYPSVTLARRIDPLEIGLRLSSGGTAPTAEAVIAEATDTIRALLHAVAPSKENVEGPRDERWYWAAPMILDGDSGNDAVVVIMHNQAKAWRLIAKDDGGAFGRHLGLALDTILDRGSALGPPPLDLAEVLAKEALGSPAVVALRTFLRHWPAPVHICILQQAAAYSAAGFRTLFNLPETTLFLRGLDDREPYWERVLDYGLAGNLQAVIDEYAHLLVDDLNLQESEISAVEVLAERIQEAVALRTTTLSVDEIFAEGEGPLAMNAHRLRCRFALAFGRVATEDDGEITREDQVRAAFNSPFRPFVLASTSIGQEGLDFHRYAHRVCHWNLPSNPVDLEQREGRVHRYKGHVIRKNVAVRFGLPGTAGHPDPWAALFAKAAAERDPGTTEIVPFWVFDGPHKIERHVPVFPLSRENARYQDLKRSLALYRLVFGQPRQEELLRLLGNRIREEGVASGLDDYRIDLSPS